MCLLTPALKAPPLNPCCPPPTSCHADPRYLLGGALNAGAHNLAMLICGRISLGFGVGFANQSVPLFLSEMVRGPPAGLGSVCMAADADLEQRHRMRCAFGYLAQRPS